MAARQGSIARRASQLINWLAVPSPVTLPVLLGVGVGLGHLLWLYVDSVKILAWISGVATPFCMMCTAAVWAMRDQIDGTLDVDGMTAREYQQLLDLNATQRFRSMLLAALTAMMALVASFPAISNQLVGPIWQWTVLAGGGAVSFSVYAYLIANYWEQQIRAYRSKRLLESKRAKEQQELADRLKSTVRPVERQTPPWTERSDLNVRVLPH